MLIIYEIFPVQAFQKNIPILVDAERKREGLDDLLNLASYVVCTEKFPQVNIADPIWLFCLYDMTFLSSINFHNIIVLFKW